MMLDADGGCLSPSSKPHICEHCNAAFRSSYHLRRHVLIHTGETSGQIFLLCRCQVQTWASIVKHTVFYVCYISSKLYLAVYNLAEGNQAKSNVLIPFYVVTFQEQRISNIKSLPLTNSTLSPSEAYGKAGC